MKQVVILVLLVGMAFSLPGCSLSEEPTPTPTPALQNITVYFTNEARFAVGTEPYEDAVNRQVAAELDPVRAVLDQFFLGPTSEEFAAGLRLVSSGFTHVRSLKVENGIARVYLGGTCANNGAAYSVGSLIGKNLSQFPQISAVKIYDENDSTLDPDSPNSSLPYCLEP